MARELRQLALDTTDLNDPVMAEMAKTAEQYMSLDVVELSWLGSTLDLAIRCTIEEKAASSWHILTAV